MKFWRTGSKYRYVISLFCYSLFQMVIVRAKVRKQILKEGKMGLIA